MPLWCNEAAPKLRGAAATWPFVLDSDHPEMSGLLALAIQTPMGMYDVFQGLTSSRTGVNDPPRMSSLGTIDGQFSGSDGPYRFTGCKALDFTQPFTIVWESELDSFSTQYPQICTTYGNGADLQTLVFYSQTAHYSDISVGKPNAGGVPTFYATVPSGIAVTGERHWGVWSFSGGGFNTIGNHAIWINGQPCALVSNTDGFASIPDEFAVGGINALTASYWTGGIRQVRVYGRAWALDDALAFWHPATRDSLFVPEPRCARSPAAGGAAALAGSAAAQASASGTITAQVPLVGAATTVVTATGALTTQHKLSGAATVNVSASGSLSITVALTGAALANALASGALSTSIALSGAALANVLATGNLLAGGAGALAGNAAAQASASGALSTSIPLQGNASALAIAAGGLTTAVPLAGVAAAVATATGNLTLTFGGLSGSAVAHALAAGTLSIQVALSGAAVAHALAVGALTGGAPSVLASRRSAHAFTASARPSSLSTRHRPWH
jgi:hypothetical protein